MLLVEAEKMLFIMALPIHIYKDKTWCQRWAVDR
jgi:hypothetical protein